MNKVLHDHRETKKELTKNQGMTWGAGHDIVALIDPQRTWWMKSWCNESRHWYRHKARFNYCRRCNKWTSAITAKEYVCAGTSDMVG